MTWQHVASVQVATRLPVHCVVAAAAILLPVVHVNPVLEQVAWQHLSLLHVAAVAPHTTVALLATSTKPAGHVCRPHSASQQAADVHDAAVGPHTVVPAAAIKPWLAGHVKVEHMTWQHVASVQVATRLPVHCVVAAAAILLPVVHVNPVLEQVAWQHLSLLHVTAVAPHTTVALLAMSTKPAGQVCSPHSASQQAADVHDAAVGPHTVVPAAATKPWLAGHVKVEHMTWQHVASVQVATRLPVHCVVAAAAILLPVVHVNPVLEQVAWQHLSLLHVTAVAPHTTVALLAMSTKPAGQVCSPHSASQQAADVHDAAVGPHTVVPAAAINPWLAASGRRTRRSSRPTHSGPCGSDQSVVGRTREGGTHDLAARRVSAGRDKVASALRRGGSRNLAPSGAREPGVGTGGVAALVVVARDSSGTTHDSRLACNVHEASRTGVQPAQCLAASGRRTRRSSRPTHRGPGGSDQAVVGRTREGGTHDLAARRVSAGRDKVASALRRGGSCNLAPSGAREPGVGTGGVAALVVVARDSSGTTHDSCLACNVHEASRTGV